MRFFVPFVFFCTGLFTSPLASAQAASCLPAWESLQTMVELETGKPRHLSYSLNSSNAQGPFQTKVLMDADYGDHQLQLTLHWDENFNGVSLPYNLYTVLVIENGQVASWQDFSQSCSAPGISFYPGQQVHIPTIKLKDDASSEKLQIFIWGRI